MLPEVQTDYWAVRGDTIDEAIDRLWQYEHEDLVSLVVNNRLNDFVSRYADYPSEQTNDTPKHERDIHGHGKRVPYIGWYWRSTDWVNKKIPIGDCISFVGIIENNKWGYRERMLTESEADRVIAVVWEAKLLSEAGGEVSEIRANTVKKLAELWDLFQEFEV